MRLTTAKCVRECEHVCLWARLMATRVKGSGGLAAVPLRGKGFGLRRPRERALLYLRANAHHQSLPLYPCPVTWAPPSGFAGKPRHVSHIGPLHDLQASPVRWFTWAMPPGCAGQALSRGSQDLHAKFGAKAKPLVPS